MNYIFNHHANLDIALGGNRSAAIDLGLFERALKDVHKVIDLIVKDIPVDVFAILGMRNLSAFIGELFAKSLEKKSAGNFIGNPHQDGYPDLLLMDARGRRTYKTLHSQGRLREKAPFSPFVDGGVEIKATCGSVPTPKQCEKKGVSKPDMGDTRIALLRGYDWKAHHRDTNNLIGLLWDFEDKIPRIMAVFFSGSLSRNDWGKIVTPKDGGGRTTSVSIMSRNGVSKMYKNWVAINDDARYINFINRYNGDQLISR